ncbi:MAG: RNA methyltransferase [Candidatus Moranbacteria bacterium]|nr:RNA methyltransferase [Candidatus Moranbacteria bacterium]
MPKKKADKKIVLIIHNVRSAHNVGAMFRTADGAGVERIFLTGYTPCPPKKEALYRTGAEKAFCKTALGAEKYIPWKKNVSFAKVARALKEEGYALVSLEQATGSTAYDAYKSTSRTALVVGNEVTGIDKKILRQCETILEIPMHGKKNSLNVSVATGIVLYELRRLLRG